MNSFITVGDFLTVSVSNVHNIVNVLKYHGDVICFIPEYPRSVENPFSAQERANVLGDSVLRFIEKDTGTESLIGELRSYAIDFSADWVELICKVCNFTGMHLSTAKYRGIVLNQYLNFDVCNIEVFPDHNEEIVKEMLFEGITGMDPVIREMGFRDTHLTVTKSSLKWVKDFKKSKEYLDLLKQYTTGEQCEQ